MKALILLNDEFGDIEAFTTIDILRRSGVEVVTAGLISTVVESARKVKTIANKRLSEVSANDFDVLILPSGPGYKRLVHSQVVLNLVRDFNKRGKYIASISAATCILAKAGVINERLAAVFPGFEKDIPRPRDAKVIVDRNIVTARAPGNAIDFGLKLVEILVGKRAIKRLKESLVIE